MELTPGNILRTAGMTALYTGGFILAVRTGLPRAALEGFARGLKFELGKQLGEGTHKEVASEPNLKPQPQATGEVATA